MAFEIPLKHVDGTSTDGISLIAHTLFPTIVDCTIQNKTVPGMLWTEQFGPPFHLSWCQWFGKIHRLASLLNLFILTIHPIVIPPHEDLVCTVSRHQEIQSW